MYSSWTFYTLCSVTGWNFNWRSSCCTCNFVLYFSNDIRCTVIWSWCSRSSSPHPRHWRVVHDIKSTANFMMSPYSVQHCAVNTGDTMRPLQGVGLWGHGLIGLQEKMLVSLGSKHSLSPSGESSEENIGEKTLFTFRIALYLVPSIIRY